MNKALAFVAGIIAMLAIMVVAGAPSNAADNAGRRGPAFPVGKYCGKASLNPAIPMPRNCGI